MVRAVVADPADRPAFDTWYEKEHLPDALAAFGVAHAWRCWSKTDPSLHFAFYEFPSVAAAEALPGSPALTAMIAGNLFELRILSGLRLLDFDLPADLAAEFAGPQFGIAGTRRLAGVEGRPIIGTIVKPSIDDWVVWVRRVA
jgi:ribulose 1,5-bisphosphate carboxylase large subunit-like protein